MKMLFKLVLIGILYFWVPLATNAWTIPVPDSYQSSIQVINKLAVKILSECYADIEHVIIHGDDDESTIKSFYDTEYFPLTIFNDSLLFDGPDQLPLNMNLFAMTSRSVSQLEKMLLDFKKSSRWNITSPFFVLDNSNQECTNTQKILQTMLNMNLIESFFICIDSDQVPMVYSYNMNTKKSDEWTIFSQRHDSENICKGLDVGRTEYAYDSSITISAELHQFNTFVPNRDYNESIELHMLKHNIYGVERMTYILTAMLTFITGRDDTPIFYIVDKKYVILARIWRQNQPKYPHEAYIMRFTLFRRKF